ncbi:MAG: iron ABC transporter permease, partial [Veillonella sp.]|nr:iron ABC transporter permease [Veillonella sp.]
WYVRMPRVFVAVLVGGALALAGTVMQGLFRNPLADPGIMGVSAGAGLGAVLAIGLGFTAVSLWAMPVMAFLGALLTVLVTVGLTMKGGRVEPTILLLAGVAMSLLCGALTSGALTLMNEYQIKEFLFWMIGGLDGRRWDHLVMGLGPILLGGLGIVSLGRQLNVLSLGDIEAQSLGLAVTRFRLILLALASAITAVAVCMSGAIGFVGLIVPHIMRRLVGPDHRFLLPASALAGAAFLLACDTLGRMLPGSGEIRVGVVTAVIGAPYFLYLLHRMRQGGGL